MRTKLSENEFKQNAVTMELKEATAKYAADKVNHLLLICTNSDRVVTRWQHNHLYPNHNSLQLLSKDFVHYKDVTCMIGWN